MTVTGRRPAERPIRSARTRARSGVIETPVGFCARGCSRRAEGPRDRARASDSGVMPSASSSTGTGTACTLLDEVEKVREAGRFHDDPIAEAHDLLERSRDAIHRPIDDRERRDIRLRPAAAKQFFQFGERRYLRIAPRVGSSRQMRQRRVERLRASPRRECRPTDRAGCSRCRRSGLVPADSAYPRAANARRSRRDRARRSRRKQTVHSRPSTRSRSTPRGGPPPRAPWEVVPRGEITRLDVSRDLRRDAERGAILDRFETDHGCLSSLVTLHRSRYGGVTVRNGREMFKLNSIRSSGEAL